MRGTDVTLIVKTQTSVDPFGEPVYTETEETIHDCLVGKPTADDVTTTIALYGKKIEYIIGIPKGDAHSWEDSEVIVFGERFRTVGYAETGIQDNIPLRWGKNIKVERYG